MKRIAFSILLLLILRQTTFSQTAQTPDDAQIAHYLKDYFSELDAQPSSLHPQFFDEFVPLPEELVEHLRATFARHRFTVAKVYLSHWGPGDVRTHILLVTEAISGEVVAHQGELFFFEGASESFYQFLTNYPATSRQDAISKVKLLSALMVASAKAGSVGKVKLNGNTITSELHLWGKPWRILKVQVGHENKFGRITMINAIMKNVVN